MLIPFLLSMFLTFPASRIDLPKQLWMCFHIQNYHSETLTSNIFTKIVYILTHLTFVLLPFSLILSYAFDYTCSVFDTMVFDEIVFEY